MIPITVKTTHKSEQLSSTMTKHRLPPAAPVRGMFSKMSRLSSREDSQETLLLGPLEDSETSLDLRKKLDNLDDLDILDKILEPLPPTLNEALHTNYNYASIAGKKLL
jgi:hypothetical protein